MKHYDELLAEGRPHRREPTYTGWPKPPEREDVDPLLREALRAEAERKALAKQVGRKVGRIMRGK